MIDLDLLRKGTLWKMTEGEDQAYDRLRYLSGVPKRLWAINDPNEVGFDTFKAKRVWLSGDETRPLAHFGADKQQTFYEGLLEACGGTETTASEKLGSKLHIEQYTGMSVMISSTPTDHYAEIAAAVVCNRLLQTYPHAFVRWVNINLMNPWGRRDGPNWDIAPNIVVLSGLMADPTKEQRVLVNGLRDWVGISGLCLMVGTGCDPVELAHRWFGITPQAYLYRVGASKRSRHVG